MLNIVHKLQVLLNSLKASAVKEHFPYVNVSEWKTSAPVHCSCTFLIAIILTQRG